MHFNFAKSFLTIGSTSEITERKFKNYVGLASTHILAINPDKKTLDNLMGYESKKEPEYVGEDDRGKYAIISFILRTDAEKNNGIEITTRSNITLRPEPAYSKDKSTVQVIDQFGNFGWIDTETAKAGQKVEGKKLDKYRMACVGECAVVDIIKKYLNVPDAYNYIEGTWVKKSEEEAKKGLFGLDKLKEYFKGDFSDLQDALALQPNNTIKVLFGVREKDGSMYQDTLLREGMVLHANVTSKGIVRLTKELQNTYDRGSFQNRIFKVQELQEFDVKPTNLETPETTSDSSEDLPWD